MSNVKYIPTSEKVEVEDYPYGFTLRTKLFDTMDFNPKKGYRHVTQTVNPKGGRLNKPKRSTYSNVMVRYYDDNNHIKVKYFEPSRTEENLMETAHFVGNHLDLFSDDELQYLNTLLLASIKLQARGKVMYGGRKFEDIKGFYEGAIDTLVKSAKDLRDHYHWVSVSIDVESLNKR